MIIDSDNNFVPSDDWEAIMMNTLSKVADFLRNKPIPEIAEFFNCDFHDAASFLSVAITTKFAIAQHRDSSSRRRSVEALLSKYVVW